MRALLSSQPIRFEFESWVKNSENGTLFPDSLSLALSLSSTICKREKSLSFSVIKYKMRFQNNDVLLCILDLFSPWCKPFFFFCCYLGSFTRLQHMEIMRRSNRKKWKKRNEWMNRHLSRVYIMEPHFFVIILFVDLMVFVTAKGNEVDDDGMKIWVSYSIRWRPGFWCVFLTSCMDFLWRYYLIMIMDKWTLTFFSLHFLQVLKGKNRPLLP